MLQRRFPSLRTIKYWCSRFNNRDFSLTDKPRAGKPQKISDKKIIKKVKENLHKTENLPLQHKEKLQLILMSPNQQYPKG